MKSISTLALATALALPLVISLPAVAQTTAPAATMSTGDMEASVDMTEGEIRKISKDTGKVTIKHGPIKNMDMPPMTMVFTAKDPAMLDKLAVGDKIRFVVTDEAGKMLVSDIQPAK